MYFDDLQPLFELASGSITVSLSISPENLVRPLDNRLGNPGQLGHVDSVALVCGAGHYRPQESNRSHHNLFLLRLTILKHMEDAVRSEGYVIGSKVSAVELEADQEISGLWRLLEHIGLLEGCCQGQTGGCQDYKLPRC